MLVPATDQVRRSLSAPRTADPADARTCSGSCICPVFARFPFSPAACCACRALGYASRTEYVNPGEEYP